MAETHGPEEAEAIEDRPWERLGMVRRDCESHRGPLLTALGMAGLLVGIASLMCLAPGLLSLPLGLVTYRLAQADLDKMATGQMDPAGARQTRTARDFGKLTVLMTLLGWPCWGLVVGMVLVVKS